MLISLASEIITKFGKQIALLVPLFFLVFLFSHSRYTAGFNDANASWKQKWDRRDIEDAIMLEKIKANEKKEEQRRKEAIYAISTNAQHEIEQAHADAVNAQYAADSLRRTIATIRNKIDRSETGRISVAAAASNARANSTILFAELFQLSDKRAGELAAYADKARLAGLACERSYYAITKTGMEKK